MAKSTSWKDSVQCLLTVRVAKATAMMKMKTIKKIARKKQSDDNDDNIITLTRKVYNHNA